MRTYHSIRKCKKHQDFAANQVICSFEIAVYAKESFPHGMVSHIQTWRKLGRIFII